MVRDSRGKRSEKKKKTGVWRRTLPNTPTATPQVEGRWKLKKRLHLRHWQCAFRSRGAAHRRTQPRTEPEQIGFHRLYIIGRRGADHPFSSVERQTDPTTTTPTTTTTTTTIVTTTTITTIITILSIVMITTTSATTKCPRRGDCDFYCAIGATTLAAAAAATGTIIISVFVPLSINPLCGGSGVFGSRILNFGSWIGKF